MTKRVLWLIKGLGLGGAEMLLAASLPHLDRDRFEYEVAYLLPWKDALVPSFREAGVAVHCLGAGSAADLRWVGRLSRLLRERRYDVVHVHSPYAAIGARLLIKGPRPAGRRSNGLRPRLYYTEHNMWERYHPVTYWANVLTYPLNDRVLAVSEAVHHSIRYPAPLRSRRMPPAETLYEGIDFQRVTDRTPHPGWRAEAGIPDSALVVGTVGNLKAHKGFSYLLEAARLVVEEIPDAFFVVVGTGPEEAGMRERMRALGLERNVRLLGFRDDALDLATGFDAFAIASVFEGFPIAVLEAMALGLPIVATDVGGIGEAIEDGTHGFLVSPRDARALATRLVSVLKDPALRARLGASARERARQFDNRAASRRREELYREGVAS